MSGSIAVIRPGLHTTVQDLGRWGLQARGVPVAGPMDVWSHRLANALVGNARTAATLEITLIGPELLFEDDRLVAVVGAEFDLSVDDTAGKIGVAQPVRAGSRLRINRRSRGARAYLAVAGGIDVPAVFGSRATHVSSRMGGHEGRALRPGDCLKLGLASRSDVSARGRDRAAAASPAAGVATVCIEPGGTARVRILPGPQSDRFDGEALQLLQSAPYRLTPDSNRMGFRLEGPALARRDDREMLSDPTAFGVVQVPRSGQPILLMADRQTTGGYPKIATIITADAGVAGQLAPGDSIRFAVCDERTALAELARKERAVQSVEALAS